MVKEGVSFSRIRLHEKNSHRQKGVNTLVSSQERTVSVVPRINRLSTAGFAPSVSIEICLLVLPKKPSQQLSSMPSRARRTVVSWADRPTRVLSWLALARPVPPPCAAPSRAARGMSRFWNRQLRFLVAENRRCEDVRISHQSNPKPGHTSGRSGRGGTRRGGRAGRSRAGLDGDRSVRPGNNRPCCPPMLPNRRPISIFGPICKVENRAEDPDLRCDWAQQSPTGDKVSDTQRCV